MTSNFVIGVDVHKRNHTFVAVDPVGRKVSTKTVAATTAGHRSAINWARTTCPGERLWGVEDVRGLSARLEVELLDAGEAVVRVPSKLTAHVRASARTYGKSDPIDALAVARAVLREPDLPVARHDPYSRDVKLLVDRRDDLVGVRTATINRLLGRLHELEPSLSVGRPPRLIYAKPREAVVHTLSAHTSVLAELARGELDEIAALTEKINELLERITDAVQDAPSLLALFGCGPLTAAKIIGETAEVARFTTEAKYARYAGVAPVPAWSGNVTGRMIAARSGNRQLHRAMYTIAFAQIRRGGPGEQYYRRRISEGDNHREALRRVERKLCRVIYQCLVDDAQARSKTSPSA